MDAAPDLIAVKPVWSLSRHLFIALKVILGE
jgi:hypothetical protein